MLEKHLLQSVMAAACCVPVLSGLWGMTSGIAMINAAGSGFADGHYRYLSGLLFAIGLGFVSCIWNIEAQGQRVQLLTAMVLVGGLARLGAVLTYGMGSGFGSGMATLFALVMELVVTPGLCFWQWRLANQYHTN